MTKLRVAVVGAGPVGFFATAELLAHPELTPQVDMFDRLPPTGSSATASLPITRASRPSPPSTPSRPTPAACITEATSSR